MCWPHAYLPRLRPHGPAVGWPRWTRDLAETDDLVQDSMLQTFKRLDRIEGVEHEGALQAYLRQAIMNRILDHVRRAAAQTPRHGRPRLGIRSILQRSPSPARSRDRCPGSRAIRTRACTYSPRRPRRPHRADRNGLLKRRTRRGR